MTIIFDFNRTLYSPETQRLIPGVLALLTELSTKGAELHLISKKEAGREDLLEVLGIDAFFTTTTFAEDKEEPIRRLTESAQDTVYVVGDYLHHEIRIGNRCGARTILLKQGKFSNLLPKSHEDIPWRTAYSIEDVRAALIEK